MAVCESMRGYARACSYESKQTSKLVIWCDTIMGIGTLLAIGVTALCLYPVSERDRVVRERERGRVRYQCFLLAAASEVLLVA